MASSSSEMAAADQRQGSCKRRKSGGMAAASKYLAYDWRQVAWRSVLAAKKYRDSSVAWRIAAPWQQ